MRFLRLLALLTCATLVGFAPAPLPRRDRDRVDPLAVSGTWQFEMWETNGNSTTSGTSYTVEMKKDSFDFVSVTSGARTHYDMSLDPTRQPWAFEWLMGGQVRYVGSYRLDGERMTMIFVTGADRSLRPTDFNGKPPYRFVLRRVAKGK